MTRNKKVPENKSWANQQEMNYGLTVHYVTNVGYLERQKKSLDSHGNAQTGFGNGIRFLSFPKKKTEKKKNVGG